MHLSLSIYKYTNKHRPNKHTKTKWKYFYMWSKWLCVQLMFTLLDVHVAQNKLMHSTNVLVRSHCLASAEWWDKCALHGRIRIIGAGWEWCIPARSFIKMQMHRMRSMQFASRNTTYLNESDIRFSLRLFHSRYFVPIQIEFLILPMAAARQNAWKDDDDAHAVCSLQFVSFFRITFSSNWNCLWHLWSCVCVYVLCTALCTPLQVNDRHRIVLVQT